MSNAFWKGKYVRAASGQQRKIRSGQGRYIRDMTNSDPWSTGLEVSSCGLYEILVVRLEVITDSYSHHYLNVSKMSKRTWKEKAKKVSLSPGKASVPKCKHTKLNKKLNNTKRKGISESSLPVCLQSYPANILLPMKGPFTKSYLPMWHFHQHSAAVTSVQVRTRSQIQWAQNKEELYWNPNAAKGRSSLVMTGDQAGLLYTHLQLKLHRNIQAPHTQPIKREKVREENHPP